MIQLEVKKIVVAEIGITVTLYDKDNISDGTNVFCPAKVPELHDWAKQRSLGDRVELAVPWSGLPAESSP